MEYTYESLCKCHGLRFRATLSDKREEGIIKVGEDCITLCYGAKDPGRLFTFERSKTLSFTEQTFGILPNDFEIVPRDPETYHDWQVGDKIIINSDVGTVIFRCGEVVIYKYRETGGNWCCACPYTCEELFREGVRLVLTDTEKQIIEAREYKPQDGDICFASTNSQRQRFIIIYDNNSYSLADFYGCGWKLREGVSWGYARIRPATDDERQKLFDAMAKEGKRWNAERKVVEDIEPEDNESADVQKMISDALKGYIPKGDIKGFPVEVIAKMLERQYEQSEVVDVSVFENDKIAFVYQSGFDWNNTLEGDSFWHDVIMERDFSEFYKRYPKAEVPGAGIPSFKRYDPVLVRDKDGEGWHPMVFSRKEGDKFYVLSYFGCPIYYKQCIPLNKDTEKLIGGTEQYYEQ